MFFFFFNDTATTEIYTLSLHDALPISGTTRDAIDLPIEVDGRRLIIVDTAGMRRQSKVTESVEYYTALRSQDRKSTRLNSSHANISYAVFCLKKKKKKSEKQVLKLH